MDKRSTRRRLALATLPALCAALFAATPALASGGSPTGGGGGGGGSTTPTTPTTTTPTTTTSGGRPCVQVNSVAAMVDQSVTTNGVSLTAGYTVSRCGGSNTGFTILLTADDAAGNRAISTSDTWLPNRSLPFSNSHSTEDALFGTTYRVTVSVVVPETGAVLATGSRSVIAPAARIPTCATITNLGGTAGYYPGITTQGALWLSYTVKNCGGSDSSTSTSPSTTPTPVSPWPTTPAGRHSPATPRPASV
jgi:hypothetical protein